LCRQRRHRGRLYRSLLRQRDSLCFPLSPERGLLRSQGESRPVHRKRQRVSWDGIPDDAADGPCILRLISSLPVQVTVDGSASDLSAGRIQGVRVDGKGWASPRGLTCRTISANVGKTGIDVDALFKVRLPGTWHCIGTACAAVMQHHGGNRQHPASSFFWYQIPPQQDITILHIKVFCNV